MKFSKGRIIALVIAGIFLIIGIKLLIASQNVTPDIDILSGDLHSSERAYDPVFNVESPNFYLKRIVEMYQFDSVKDGLVRYAFKESEARSITVEYEDLAEEYFSLLGTIIPEKFAGQIKDHPLSEKVEFINPKFPFAERSKDFFIAPEIGESGIKLSKKLIEVLNADSYYTFDSKTPFYYLSRELPQDGGADFSLTLRNGVYLSDKQNIDEPRVGDIRVSFRTVVVEELGPFTVGGEIKDGSIGADKLMIYNRLMDKDEFLQAEKKTQRSGAIVPLVIAFLIAGIALFRAYDAKKLEEKAKNSPERKLEVDEILAEMERMEAEEEAALEAELKSIEAEDEGKFPKH